MKKRRHQVKTGDRFKFWNIVAFSHRRKDKLYWNVECNNRFFSVEEAEQMKKNTEHQLLERLVDLGNKFRLTPIVDDDFPNQRDNFDRCLAEATEYLRKKRQGNQ